MNKSEIEITNWTDHEDGSASFQVTMSEKTCEIVVQDWFIRVLTEICGIREKEFDDGKK